MKRLVFLMAATIATFGYLFYVLITPLDGDWTPELFGSPILGWFIALSVIAAFLIGLTNPSIGLDDDQKELLAEAMAREKARKEQGK